MRPVCWLLVALAIPHAGWATPRHAVSLNGDWEMVEVASLDAPPAAGWRPVRVPGTIRGHDYKRAWFRRRFAVSADWQGRRVRVRFGGVKYNSRVRVNGQPVGGCFNGHDPFEVDVTAAVRPGADNELAVGVHDWTGIFTGDRVDFGGEGNWHRLRELPRDRILGPIGGQYGQYGLWGDVTLLALPPVHFDSLTFRPSVRRNRVEVDVTVVNTGARAFTGAVHARLFPWTDTPRDRTGQWPVSGEPACVLPSTQVTVGPGQKRRVTLGLDKPALARWWPNDPRLYVLQLSLDTPGTDVLRRRVGFRELWTDGGDLVLNGNKVHLLGTSWWPPREPFAPAQVREQLLAIKGMNGVCFRTHTQPWRSVWYEVADEVGMMMIPEGAVWNDDDVYRINDPRFWKHYGDHLRSMVRSLGHHASVVMWSLENEFFGRRAANHSPAEKHLAELGRMVKRLDPTRPITFESDGDPGGVADVIGIHYPNEYPERRLWPNDAFWMDKPRLIHGGGGMFWHEREFLWRRRKPLYIGEYLWAPSRDPGPQTIFFGDAAYKDYAAYRTRAKALAWRMQILAYRHYGVSGQCPWTVIEQGPLDERNPCWLAQRDMYWPLAAYVREFDRRFFAGETVTRTLLVFNDTLRDQPEVVLRRELLDGDKSVARSESRLSLASAERRTLTLRLPMPATRKRRRLTLRISLHTDGKQAFGADWPIEVFPRVKQWSTVRSPLHVYDPKRRLRTIWEHGGLAFKAVDRLRDWRGQGVLVIGPDALGGEVGGDRVPVIGGPLGPVRWLARCVAQGGRVLVLAQTGAASRYLPVRLTDQESTMAFAQTPSHPILRGLGTDAFHWWRGDHLVSRHEPIRPTAGGMRALVVTGTAQGISHAPLVEVPQGRGTWLVCQLRVVAKMDTEPMAQVLLDRMVAYLDGYRPPQGATVCMGPPALGRELTRLGVDWSPLADWSALNHPAVRLLVVQTDADLADAARARLRAFVQSGGQVVWHRPKPDAFNRAARAMGVAVTLQQYAGPAVRAEGDDPLVGALTREDLYWLGQRGPVGWSATSLATDMAEGVFAYSVPVRGRPVPAGKDVELEGALVEAGDQGVAFYSAGRAHWQVDLPATGTYVLGLVARGTPADGVYPLAEVYLDGRRIGMVYVGSTTARTYAVPFDATAGRRRLTVAFTNDLAKPPEDRNLFVTQFVLGKGQAGTGMHALTMPAALVRMPMGAGQLVLSTIRWDAPGQNARRARRFMCSLLTALGARFRSRADVAVVEARTLHEQPDLPNFRRARDHVYMGSDGFIEGPVDVREPGRYRVYVWAKGTRVDGQYPIVVLSVGGKDIGRVECASDDWAPHQLDVHLPAGRADLRVSFVNDFYDPDTDADRNLWVDRLEFQPLDKPGADRHPPE